MTPRRTTSADTAAAFARSYHRKLKRQPRPIRSRRVVAETKVPAQKRVVLDLAPVTLAEILDCVAERIARHRERGEEVPHITQIALKMLHDATEKP